MLRPTEILVWWCMVFIAYIFIGVLVFTIAYPCRRPMRVHVGLVTATQCELEW